jgi:hypothetical protein
MAVEESEVSLRLIQVGIVSLPVLLILVQTILKMGDDNILRRHTIRGVESLPFDTETSVGSFVTAMLLWVLSLSILVTIMVIISIAYLIYTVDIGLLLYSALVPVVVYLILFEFIIYSFYKRQSRLDSYREEEERALARILNIPDIPEENSVSKRELAVLWKEDRETYEKVRLIYEVGEKVDKIAEKIENISPEELAEKGIDTDKVEIQLEEVEDIEEQKENLEEIEEKLEEDE